MTVNAANPEVLPRTDLGAKLRIAKPNKIPLVANTPESIPVALPSVFLVTTASAATVIAVPDQFDGSAIGQGEVYTAIKLSDTSYLFYFHAPGRWKVRSTVAGSGVLIDAYDGILPMLLALRAVGIAGSGGTADVRNADAANDFAAALLGLVTNSRLSGFDAVGGAADWLRLNAATGGQTNGFVGTDPGNSTWLQVAAFLTGRDSTGGGNGLTRLIEARDASAPGDFTSTLIGLLTNSRLSVRSSSPATAEYNRVGGYDVTDGASVAGVMTVPMRSESFIDGIGSRYFVLSPNDPTVQIQATVGYAATAPAICIQNTTTVDLLVERIELFPLQAITAASLHAHVKADPDDRYTSGGISFIPTGGFKSTNRDGTAGAAYTPTEARYYDGVSAIVSPAEDNDEFSGGTQDFKETEEPVVFNYKDGLVVPPSGTLLIYVWSIGGGEDFTCAIHGKVAAFQ